MASAMLPTPLPPDENRAHILLGVMITCLTLSVTFIALRIWVRLTMVKQLGLDDWFMIVALVSAPLAASY